MFNIFIALFLIIEGLNRCGLRFTADEIVKGVLLFLAGLFLLMQNF